MRGTGFRIMEPFADQAGIQISGYRQSHFRRILRRGRRQSRGIHEFLRIRSQQRAA